jgi:hypothetical protein
MSHSVIHTSEVQGFIVHLKRILDVALVACTVAVDEEEPVPVEEVYV